MSRAQLAVLWRRALVYFGLAGGTGRSRYGGYVSPRLDQDLDELAARVAALERGH